MDGASNCGVYINTPFAPMNTEQYAIPRFLCEVQHNDGKAYELETLKLIMIGLRKFLQIEGRVEEFLSDKT